MKQNFYQTNPQPTVAELALSIAMSGKSWEEFSDAVADKVFCRMRDTFPAMREVGAVAEGEKPVRGVRAICAYFGMSTATLNKLMKEGKIPFRQIGNRFLFYPSEVDAALKGGAAV